MNRMASSHQVGAVRLTYMIENFSSYIPGLWQLCPSWTIYRALAIRSHIFGNPVLPSATRLMREFRFLFMLTEGPTSRCSCCWVPFSRLDERTPKHTAYGGLLWHLPNGARDISPEPKHTSKLFPQPNTALNMRQLTFMQAMPPEPGFKV